MEKKKYIRPQLLTVAIDWQLMQNNSLGKNEILSREKGWQATRRTRTAIGN